MRHPDCSKRLDQAKVIYTSRLGDGIVTAGESPAGISGKFYGRYQEKGLDSFTAGHGSLEEAVSGIRIQEGMNRFHRRMNPRKYGVSG